MNTTWEVEFFEKEIYPLHGDLLGLVYLLSKDSELAQDVVQDAMEICWRNLKQIKEYRNLRNGIITITLNRFYRLSRLTQRQASVVNSEDVMRRVSDENSPEQIIVRREMEASCRIALSYLREDYQKIIILYYFYDLNLKTIVKALQLNYNTVVSWHRRAKKELNYILGQLNKGDLEEVTERIKLI